MLSLLPFKAFEFEPSFIKKKIAGLKYTKGKSKIKGDRLPRFTGQELVTSHTKSNRYCNRKQKDFKM